MSTEETILRSPLDKPLHQLTEEDISQLTREDCRRYLKEKGMRRPSWNKSQAIQQVISLKTLLETTPDSAAGARKKLYIPRPENLHRVHKSASVDAPICVPAEESAPCQRKDPEKRELSGDRLIANGDDSHPPRYCPGGSSSACLQSSSRSVQCGSRSVPATFSYSRTRSRKRVLKDSLKYMAFPVYAITCFPVTVFAMAQFPLYFDLIKAKYTGLPQRRQKVVA
ncbi:protein TIFY 4B-like [Actinidia eriantha]|uniref:protein TIFY 4B-like n=1 Tax=Actinidia eriantha TaxID=165200 RepID=UPI0025827514|nr:protein TIFY 4B-like [Actinidia eriantha]